MTEKRDILPRFTSDDDAFIELASLYLERRIQEAQFRQLSQWLHESSDLRRKFALLCMQDAMIRRIKETADRSNDFSDSVFDEDSAMLLREVMDQEHRAKQKREAEALALRQQKESESRERVQLQRMLMGKSDEDLRVMRHYIIPRPVAYAAVAALLVAGLWIASLLTQPADQPNQLATQTQNQALATLIDHVDAQWEDASHAISVGRPIQDRHLKLTRGAATLRMASEAEVTLEAPCVIELVSDNEIRLHEGKLVGLCETPASRNFVVRSRNVRVIDRGTQFGIIAHAEEDAQVHVFDGRVDVEIFDPADENILVQTQSVTPGQAVRVAQASGQLQMLRSQPHAFVREVQEVKLSAADRYAQMILDAEPYGYWRFESVAPGGMVADEAMGQYGLKLYGDAQLREGAISSGLYLSGDAKKEGHAVTVRSLDAFSTETYSMELWARPDRVHSGVLTFMQKTETDRNPIGFGHIEFRHADIEQHPGVLRFSHGHTHSDSHGDSSVFCDEPYIVDQWVHIVAVKEGLTLSFYVNGQFQGSKVLETALDDPFDLFLGKLGTQSRYFAGWIDEVALYPRVLSVGEIEQHYQTGRKSLNDENEKPALREGNVKGDS